MLNQDFIEQLSRKAADLFPLASDMRDDVESKMEALLQKSFSRLNLVTREEFDARAEALQRTQATISQLEARVAELEAALNKDPGSS